MGKITITTEMLQNATDYIPLLTKQSLAETIAEKCIATVKMTATIGEEAELTAIPDRFQEKRELIAMYQMGVFVTYYLKQEYSGDNDYQMAANVYDTWAGSHIFNQMERLKGDKDVKDKVFNILYDYKEFQWMLRREIETILGHRNDTVARMAALNAESAAAGMLAAAEMAAKTRGAEPSVTEMAAKIAEARNKIAGLQTAKAEVDKASEELKEAKRLVDQKRTLVDEFSTKLVAKKGTEAGYNVRAD